MRQVAALLHSFLRPDPVCDLESGAPAGKRKYLPEDSLGELLRACTGHDISPEVLLCIL